MILICSACGPKESSEFNKRGNRKQSLCKECQRKASKRHYNSNKEAYHKRNVAQRHEIKEFVDNVKRDRPCEDCGNIFPPYVMDFDHKKDKKFSIAKAATLGLSFERIKEEIYKCDLVCSNCHRIRTHSRNKRFIGKSSNR